MSQGLAVTWDNPDIQIFRGGTPVASGDLKPDTVYEVRATIWNGSFDAPALGLPVSLTSMSFGIGAAETFVDATAVDLPAKGVVGHPATAKLRWRTPAEEGHYCLRVRLDWLDDANPANNLGQENTDVRSPKSPALFKVPLRNERGHTRRFDLTVDAYQTRAPMPCVPDKRSYEGRREESEARWRAARVSHARSAFPVPVGWTVQVVPQSVELEADAEQVLEVSIEPPPGFTGRQGFNLSADCEGDLIGGVTLYVEV